MDQPSCPRCGGAMPPPRPTGRPATWCSDRCKRAAYEERRAAANGAIAVTIIEKVVVQDAHDLHGCTNRVMESSVACRRVVDHLAILAREGRLTDPKWDATIRSLRNLVLDLTPRR